ncbi:MAG: matrixin family metalloprotease [Terriglobales bacterium]
MSKLRLLFGALLLLFAATSAFAWLPELTGSVSPANDRWNFNSFPVNWNLNPRIGSNIQGSRSVHDVIAASFATWQQAPNAALNVTEGRESDVNSESNSPASINLICFVCTDADFANDTNTLAVTITTTANAPGQNDGHGGVSAFAGQILKADIIFNPRVQFSTDIGGVGEDLQTVATHEVGHFFGLDHSAVVRAVMFPFASDLITLSYDDVAGISTLYPKGTPDYASGSIAGRVRFASGTPVFGAHVFAESTTANQPLGPNIRKSPVGTLSLANGNYTIKGLPADTYSVTAEPLDGPVANGDIDGFATANGKNAVDTDFTTRSH